MAGKPRPLDYETIEILVGFFAIIVFAVVLVVIQRI